MVLVALWPGPMEREVGLNEVVHPPGSEEAKLKEAAEHEDESLLVTVTV